MTDRDVPVIFVLGKEKKEEGKTCQHFPKTTKDDYLEGVINLLFLSRR